MQISKAESLMDVGKTHFLLLLYRGCLTLAFFSVFLALPQISNAQTPSPVSSIPSGSDITVITDDIYCKGLERSGLPSPTPHCPHDGENGEDGDTEDGDENAPPIIILNGDSTVTLTVGDTFNDPGATAEDAEDGDLTGSIVVSGSVDTGTPGTYILVYSVTDSGGKSAEVLRTVVIGEGASDGDDDNGAGKEENGDSDDSSSGGSSGGGSGSGGGGSGGRVLGTVIPPNTFEEPPALDTSICPAFLLEYIRQDASNNPVEVLKLQQFLREEEGFGDVLLSGVYDTPTYEAVHAFQSRYATDILLPWGATQSTGFVYYTTQKKINEIHCDNARQFALNAAQLAEIDAFKNRDNATEESGTDVPDSFLIGLGGEAATFAEGPRQTPEEVEAEGDREVADASQLAGAAEARGVAESSLKRVFQGIRGFLGGLFEAVF